jgi:excisionase family DNA binding protein
MAAATTTLDPKPMYTKLMYTKDECSRLLSVSLRTIENLIANKQLTIRKIGRRVLVPHQVLMQFTRGDHHTGGTD